MTLAALRAGAKVVARLGPDGATRLEELRSSAPLALRRAAGALWMVGTAAGPLPGDRVTLSIDVGAGATLALRSTAAVVALGGLDHDRSELLVDVDVGPGGELRWLPEPTVATAGCHHRTIARVRLAGDALLVWRDELVLGRYGEMPGRVASRIDIERGGDPVLRQEVQVGPGAPGWQGPAVTGGAGAVGVVVVVEPVTVSTVTSPPARSRPGTSLDPEVAVLPLAHGGVLVTAVAPGAAELRRRLEAGLAASDGEAGQGASSSA